MSPKLIFKVVLIGDGAVGKTSLRRRYMGEGFRADFLSTDKVMMKSFQFCCSSSGGVFMICSFPLTSTVYVILSPLHDFVQDDEMGFVEDVSETFVGGG